MSGTVRLPGSKSISNRILLLAALAGGETRIFDMVDGEGARRAQRGSDAHWMTTSFNTTRHPPS